MSIDDTVAIKHDEFRGYKGSFNRSMATIRRFIERGVETNIGFTLTPRNLDALDNIVALAESLGVTVLNIGLVANLGRAYKNMLVKDVDFESIHVDSFMEDVYQKIKKLAVLSSSVKILLPFRVPGENSTFESYKKKFICDGDNTQILYIMANGDIMPCDKLPIGTFSYGNVRRKSVLDVWLSQQMKNFKLMSPEQLPICKTCIYLEICGGACVARSYQGGGSLESTDLASCAIAQKFYQNNMA